MNLGDVGVAGSNPVTPTNKIKMFSLVVPLGVSVIGSRRTQDRQEVIADLMLDDRGILGFLDFMELPDHERSCQSIS